MSNNYLIATRGISKSLKSMIQILQKAQSWAKEQNKTEEEILHSRLASDMFPFVKQIQIMSDNAKAITSRFTGVENPKYEDNEASIDELVQRIQKTIDFIAAVPAEQYDDAHNKKIVLPYIDGKYQDAEDYLVDYALPNFYFHTTVAYSILRHIGMPIGKMDYIGSLNLKDL